MGFTNGGRGDGWDLLMGVGGWMGFTNGGRGGMDGIQIF